MNKNIAPDNKHYNQVDLYHFYSNSLPSPLQMSFYIHL